MAQYLPQWIRNTLRSLRNTAISFPRHVMCNICGWQGRYFLSDAWHPHTVCPSCHSLIRHRLLFAALEHKKELSFSRLVEHKDVLHFAPETIVKSMLQPYADTYVTADLFTGGVDLVLDIADMRTVEPGRFDLVIACDVLEHVPDDRRAKREICRILRPGGYAILTVPQKDGLDTTLEDKSVTNPAGRQRLYGQSDHVRIYGRDFPKLLQTAGFEVTVINEKDFSQDLVQRHVLFPPVLSKDPLATNYRKVFFARKI